MPPTKQRLHYVLARDFEAARPTVDALLSDGLDYADVRFLKYSTHLRGHKPEDVAFVFTPSFKDHPSYTDCAVRVHGMIALGAIVKPIPQLRLEQIAEESSRDTGMQGVEPTMSWVDEAVGFEIDGYSKHWDRIFRNVVRDGVGDQPRGSLRQAAEKAADILDPPCDCYYCRTFVLIGEADASEYHLDGSSNSAESAPEEPVEYMQVFLGGFYHGTKAPQISIVPGTEFFFTDDADFYETYRLTDHSVLGKLMYFWIQVELWDDRQRIVREYLLEPLEA